MEKKLLAMFLFLGITLSMSGCSDAGHKGMDDSVSAAAAMKESGETGPEDTGGRSESLAGNVKSTKGSGLVSHDEHTSAENSVLAYLSALRSSDLEAMLDTFGADRYVDAPGMEQASDLFFSDFLMPKPDSPAAGFVKKLVVENEKCRIADDILGQYVILCQMDMDIDITGKPRVFSNTQDADKFFDQITGKMKATDLSSLKLLGYISDKAILEAVDSYSDVDVYQKLQNIEAQNYGADKIENHVPVVDLNECQYSLMMEEADYGGEWYNLKLGGVLADLAGFEREDSGTEQFDAQDEDNQAEITAGQGGDSLEVYTGKTAVPVEGPGFDTPQEAVESYLESLKEYDPEKMIRTFAVESYVNGYDFKADLESYKGYSFKKERFNLPVVNDFSRAINIRTRKKDIIKEIADQYAILLDYSEESFDGSPAKSDKTEELDLNTMKILGYIPAEVLTAGFDFENIQDTMNKRAAMGGSGQAENCVLVFEINGKKYCLFAEVIQYNGKWRILDLGGYLSTFLRFGEAIVPADALDQVDLNGSIVPIE